MCNEEDSSSQCRDPGVVLHWARGHPGGVQGCSTPRSPVLHLPALPCLQQALPYSGSWGLKVTDSKANTVSLSHQVRHIHRVIPTRATLMLPHHLWERKGGLHEFSLSNLACIWCSQGILPTHAWRWHCTGASKPWQALGTLINNCTRNPPFQKESAFRHTACSEWSWFWPATCL